MHGTMPRPAATAEAPDLVVADFKAAMRQLAAGVVIITAVHEGRRSGLTATAACSLTTDPPALLVCVNRSSHTHDYIANGGHFRLNALATHHQEIAEVFAGATRLEGEAKFAHGDWSAPGQDTPRLLDALASVECEVTRQIEVGTHTIFIGRVLNAQAAPQYRPLVYADRQFLHLAAGPH